MPKSLYDWLHRSALQWMMPTEAVRSDHGGTWHKASGDESWTECGKWVAGSFMREGAGFGPHRYKKKSPWWGNGSLHTDKLCPECFDYELPILQELESITIHGREPTLRRKT